MKTITITVLAGLLIASGPAWANAKLIKDKQCLQCHAVSEQTIGPSFKKIKQLWKGTKGAEDKLVATIRKGSVDGSGRHWGEIKMPDDSERPLVSEREARQMVRWIMTQ